MTKIKIIPRQTPPGATPLTAAELNNIRFSDKHTILTPELLEQKTPQTGVSSVPPVSPSGTNISSSEGASSGGATITLS